MNKLFTKIATLALGATMAVGVGVAVASNAKEPTRVEAASETGYAEPGSGGKFSEAGWSNSGLGSKYADGSAKFDTNGDNIYKTDLFSGNVSSNMTSLQVDVQYKINGTGAAANGVTIAPYVNGTYVTGTTQTGFSSTSKTTKSVTVSSGLAGCTGFKLSYVKSSGNLGVYKVSWTATYAGSTTYTVTITVNNSGYGSVDKSSVTSITSGTSISASSNVLTIGTNTVTATAETSTPQFTYAFSSWSGIPAGGTVTGNITVTANFSRTVNPVSSLAITGSMTNTTYTQGDAWNPTGFTVNAYYTGSSTPVNVTSDVQWSYNPETTASTSTTSVTCTASFGGKTATSSAQSVTINEKQNLGGLVSGEKYFIIANGRYLGAFNSAPGAPAGTSKAWPGDESAPTSDDDAWLFTGTSTDDNWIITSKAGNTLYATATNNGLGCTSSGNDNWTVHDTANGLKITASNGRYLTQYGQSNFRVYTSTTGQTEADSTVRFVKYVAPATIESVEFTGDMTKKAYYVGDSWDYSGLSLQANLSDETTENLGTINSLIQSGDFEIEANPSEPALNVSSVTLTGLYGSNLLEAEVTITGISVSTPRTLQNVSLNGDMDTKTYNEGDPWNVTGLYLTLTYDVGLPDTIQLSLLTKDTDYIFDHDLAVVGDTEIEITGEYEGFDFDKTVTGIVVNALPGVINFGNTTGHWAPDASGSTYTDNKNNTSTITSDSTSWATRSSNYQQIGSNASPATYVLVSIPLSQKAGIDSVSVTFSSSGSNSVDLAVYGDTVDDVIVNGSAPDATNVTVSTGAEYTKINATNLHVMFEPTKGVKITSISYTLGSIVQDFGILSSIEISSSSKHSTVFEVEHTFSTEGLIITATDTVGFKKDFSIGFTTDYDGVTFEEIAEDIEVTVTFTLGEVTKTTSYFIDVIEIPTYSLVESQDSLYEGMKVILVDDTTTTRTVGAYGSNQYGVGTATFDGDDIVEISDTVEFTVRIYGDYIAFQNGSHYISYHGSSNEAYQTTTLNIEAAWSYSTDDSSTDGLASANVEGRYLEANSSSAKVACYTHSQHGLRVYVSSATTKTDLMGAETYAQKYLHMRDYTEDLDWCKDSEHHYYTTAKAAYANLSSQEKTEFASLTDAVTRLQHWAYANGETFDPTAKTFTAGNGLIMGHNIESSSMIAIIVVISIVSVSAIGGYFFLRKRKETN